MSTNRNTNTPPIPPVSEASGEPVTRRDRRVTMRPAYRRGPEYLRCGLRLRETVYRALLAESRRRRRWASELAEKILEEGLQRLRGKPLEGSGARARADGELVVTGTQRHYVRLAIEAPLWALLQCEADSHRLSVAQLVRQLVGDLVYRGQLGSARSQSRQDSFLAAHICEPGDSPRGCGRMTVEECEHA